MELSNTKIRYLLTILELMRQNKKARSVDIAVSLGVSRSSVHRMLCTLAELGLLSKEFRQSVTLTAIGIASVQQFTSQYELLFPFFTQQLQLKEYDAQELSISLLSAANANCVQQLCAAIVSQQPKNKPNMLTQGCAPK